MNSILTFVLSLSLILGPYAPALAQSGTPRQCAPDEILNPSSNTCVRTEASRTAQIEANDECNAITDPQLKASCMKDLVDEKTSRAESNGDMAKHSDKASKISLLPVLLAFTTLYAAIYHQVTKGPNCPGSKSSYLMIGGAVAILATEVMTKTSFSKELKKSQEKLKELSSGSAGANSDNANATNLQAEIFQALIDRENGVIKAAEGKKKGYNLAKLMFLGATIAAGFEVAAFISKSAVVPAGPALAKALYVCTDAIVSSTKSIITDPVYAFLNFRQQTGSDIDFETYQQSMFSSNIDSIENFHANSVDRARFISGIHSSLSLDEYAQIKLTHSDESTQPKLLKTAYELIRKLTIPEANAAIVEIKVAEAVGIKKFFSTPFSRVVLAGLMTGVTFTLTGHADKEIKKANKRIEVLNRLLAQVTEAGPTINCANGTEQENEECKLKAPTTIKPGDSTFGLAATQPNGSANTKGKSSFAAKGCAAKNGQADPDCNCKKTNSCFAMQSNLTIGDFPAGKILGNGINDVNALTSGEISPAGLDNTALNANLAAAGKMKDKVLADLNKDPKIAEELKKAQDGLNGMQRQMFNDMPANAPAPSLAMGGDDDFSSLTGNQVLEKVKEELKESSAPTVTNEAVAGSGDSEFNFDYGNADPMDVGTGLSEGEGASNVNINDFELAESEIHPSSTTNLFDILSSRYKKSAFRRLLKADKEIAPEAPAEREIND